jgi:hypothetical protein
MNEEQKFTKIEGDRVKNSANYTELVSWKGEDGFYAELQGMDNHNAWSTDTVGPFETREEAEDEAREYLDNN